MGFFKDTVASMKADIATGDTAAIERAADKLVYALMEGAGTTEQNLRDITQAINDSNK